MAVAGPGQLNVEEYPSWGSRSVDCFEKLEQIGEGTYGQVYMAREIRTGEIVALKKIRMDNEKEGFPITAIREIKILKKLHHENVIKLKEIVTSPGPETDEQGNQDGNKFKGGIYMVFEYMDHDLTGLADRPGLRFTVPQIKCYMKQLLTGLHYCHVNQVLHRDIKGSNLLIDNEGNLKLADFGLARSFSTDHTGNLTNRVITLWYRPPELLLGATKYGPAVDMWSVGCIFAELLNGKPILPGKNEPEQLNKIFELCGSPDEINWPGVSKMPWYNNFKPSRPMKRRIREVFRHFDRHALDLLDSMLTLNPDKRISAQDALVAEYFWNDPLPCDPKSLPKYESSHEFQTKKKRQQQRQNEETAKRQKLQHPQQHARLPPIQQHTGQAHPSHWHGPNHPINNAQPPVSTGPSHNQYGRPRGPPGGPNRYPPSANQSGGGYNQNRGAQVGSYSGGPYPSQGRGPPYGGSGMPAPSQRGAASGYGVGPPNYSQSGQFGGSAGGRGPNPLGGNRNQQYGWQQ
ncbi:cyclin-dependent kinase C-1-like isoform X1 [Juglans microcarpa x Juglans regia]|uniref:cyclin-dependent kinase C-1-like isoform X1 n=2 Tax=Juglans microcarpa x Juglans regia TaxID=2249226 RepID=UPI001B7F12BD|nr:cyclin-dependent kinase C-1-like isoform X1 [Juglans microcarpa x Juglans regia]